jgi:hypothetical protein
MIETIRFHMKNHENEFKDEPELLRLLRLGSLFRTALLDENHEMKRVPYLK